jgi:hypothetical protein
MISTEYHEEEKNETNDLILLLPLNFPIASILFTVFLHKLNKICHASKFVTSFGSFPHH